MRKLTKTESEWIANNKLSREEPYRHYHECYNDSIMPYPNLEFGKRPSIDGYLSNFDLLKVAKKAGITKTDIAILKAIYAGSTHNEISRKLKKSRQFVGKRLGIAIKRIQEYLNVY